MLHKILIIDDEEEVHNTVRLQLRETDFEVIVLTGYPDVNLAVDLMKVGVVEYLVKPVEKDKLIEAVTKAAQQHRIFSGDRSGI